MTPKQERFVQEYLVDLNATQAATRAGYSPKTANEQGSRLLANASVKTAIETAQAARATRIGITQDRVLQELARLGFSDLRGIFTADGSLKSLQELTDEQAAMIASVEVVTKAGGFETDVDGKQVRTVEYVHKIKAWDKPHTLGLIAKHLGMLTEKHEVSGPSGSAITTVVHTHITESK